MDNYAVNKADKKERGAVTIVEAVFVFPIVFFVLLFLIYLGNGYYQKAKVDSYVTQYAIAMAAQGADPMLADIGNSVPKSISDIKPYRYVFGIKGVNIDQKLRSAVKNGGFFLGMEPKIKKCTAKFNSHVLYTTCEVELEYAVTLPIRFFWSGDVEILNLTSRAEVPVTDVGEFIRNTDMAIDYLEQSKMAQEAKQKISSAMSKAKEFLGKFTNGGG